MSAVSDPEPMRHTDMPMSKPWEKVHIDICGPFPTGANILGIIDASSRWPEIHIIRSTTSESIANCLEKTFTTHGYPLTIVTDNAPNLTSADIDEYCNLYGIDHHKAIPYWPQGNSEIERCIGPWGNLSKQQTQRDATGRKKSSSFCLLTGTLRIVPPT